MSKIAIQIKNISKMYRIGIEDEVHDTLSGKLFSWIKSPLKNYKKLRSLTKFEKNNDDKDVIWALKDISFNVNNGDVLGIIGKNGAGKSTLLKVLSRITEATSGTITVDGRIASLLEVGTGFHPELTGRENVFLNGTILGMTKKEILKKFDQIIDFSGINEFIDTPVKRYSSGMRVRLAFAVAAHLEPEILLIDEVLAVGDTEFQNKCLDKMDDISSKGRTIIFVSHNLEAIESICDKVVVLKKGKIIAQETANKAISIYLNNEANKFHSLDDFRSYKMNSNMLFKTIKCMDNDIKIGDKIKLLVTVKSKVSESGVIFGVLIFNNLSKPIGASYTKKYDIKPGINKHIFSLANIKLLPGEYSLGMSIGKGDYRGRKDFDIILGYPQFRIKPNNELIKTFKIRKELGDIIFDIEY